MSKLKILSTICAVSALALAAGAASASTVKITNITAEWMSVDPSYGITNSGPASSGVGDATASLRWGNPSGQPRQSGYDFKVTSNPPNPNETPATTYDLDLGDKMTLGKFTHLNYPITESYNKPALDSATLKVSFSVLLEESTSPLTLTSFYDFDHWETPNRDMPCADGGWPGFDINAAGCADRVTVSFDAGQSDTITIGDVEYTFFVSGFLGADGHDKNVFWTRENQKDSADIEVTFGKYVAPEVAPVPLPAAGWLLLGGIGALGVARRRRKAA